ncbi:MAG: mitochondrial fission ELM1 family protein [Rhodospirillaceae bacterium]|jgi:mitochondrial fission protein ELM1|nr:mitochondrial fission ELM1 family protein [Rhodospirillaceae bacterium]
MNRIWVLADDRPGNVTQGLGVAEALAEPFCIRKITYDKYGCWPNLLKGASLFGVTTSSRMTLIPPWPDLVIGAGRRTAPVARWIKRHSMCRIIQLMNPGWLGSWDFDLIIVPKHDSLMDRSNIFRVLGSCHRASSKVLITEATKWSEQLSHLPRPYLVVLVGGATKKRDFSSELGCKLATGISDLHRFMGGSILVSTSRRTSSVLAKVLIDNLPQPNFCFYWNDKGDNPYLGFIALADAIVVTGDSMNMCSEACANTVPVYIFNQSNLINNKYKRLHMMLFAEGYAKPLGDDCSFWIHTSLNASVDVANEIRNRKLI